MDNFSPTKLAASMQVQHAVPDAQQAGQAQAAFEQQFAGAREATVVDEAAPEAPPPQRPKDIRSIIRRAVQAEAARRNLSLQTVRAYASALHKLEKDLSSGGETIATLDHNSLVARAEKFFSRDSAMAPALTALHRYRNPRRYVVPSAIGGGPVNEAAPPADNYPHLSKLDRGLIDNAVRHFGRSLQGSTAYKYGRALRTLGNDLGSLGKAIDRLDHAALVLHAKTPFPGDGHLLSALSALRKYREPDPLPDGRHDFPSEEDAILIDGAVQAAAARRERASAAEGPPPGGDDLAFSPLLSVDPEELRRLLDDE